MKTRDTDAIVLRAMDYGEADRLITFLTSDAGRIAGIAKSARRSRKRFANSLEPCSLVRLSYRERKGLAWLETCKLMDAHLLLRADMVRWSYAALASEILVEMTPEGEAQDSLFVLFRESLQRFSTDSDPSNVFVLFLIRFMHVMGYLPEFLQCSLCRRDLAESDGWYWAVSEGRVLCSEHPVNRASHLQMDLGSLLLIRQVRRLPVEKIWRLRIRQAKKGPLRLSLQQWVMGQIHKPLKTLKVLEQLERNERQMANEPAH